MKKNFVLLVIGIMVLFLGQKFFVSACDENTCNKTETSTTRTTCPTGYSGTITETRTQHEEKTRSEEHNFFGGNHFDESKTECVWGDWEVTSNTCTINTYAFTVSKTGTGTGTVSGDGTYDFGTTVTATAIADAGSTFSGWTGDCNANGNVVMDGPKTCTATFTKDEEIKYTVTATAGDNGTITPASQEAEPGTTVALTVTADEGYTAEIAGTCPTGTLVGTTYTTSEITKDCTVEATFTKIPENSYVLTANKLGTGTGVITGAGTYVSGTVVTLSVTPDSNSTFDGWSENCPGGVVTVTGNTTCTATFTLKPIESDVCPNIEGVQTSIPSGLRINSSRDCVRKSSGGGSGSMPQLSTPGEVLGESTTCGIYIDKYMKIGLKGNDPVAVRKVQIFLNDYMGSGLVVDGILGVKTDAAIRAFQAKQFDKVLKPWELGAPTGIFYLTTQTEVNNIMCPSLNLPIPPLVPINQNPAFPQY